MAFLTGKRAAAIDLLPPGGIPQLNHFGCKLLQFSRTEALSFITKPPGQSQSFDQPGLRAL